MHIISFILIEKLPLKCSFLECYEYKAQAHIYPYGIVKSHRNKKTYGEDYNMLEGPKISWFGLCTLELWDYFDGGNGWLSSFIFRSSQLPPFSPAYQTWNYVLYQSLSVK